MIIEENILNLLLIIILLLNLIVFWIQNYITQKAKNRADKEDSRKINYESEKGKNLATKEDVEDITRKVEEVKNLVSFTAQKRFDHLNEQERILIEILHVATQISQSQNKLILYLYDTTSRNRYDLLVDFVNERLEYFCHLSNLARITVQDDEVYERIESLSKGVTFLGLQVCTIATNAANLVNQCSNEMDYALNKTSNEKEKFEWLSRAINDKQKIEKMRDKPVEGKNELNKAIGDYCFWLKTLYGKEYFTYKNTPR